MHHWNSASIKMVKNRYTLIEQSPILIKQLHTIIEGWFILIEQSFTSTEQPPTPKTANPESTFLKLGSHAWIYYYYSIKMCKYMSIIWRIIGAVNIILGIIGKKKEISERRFWSIIDLAWDRNFIKFKLLSSPFAWLHLHHPVHVFRVKSLSAPCRAPVKSSIFFFTT